MSETARANLEAARALVAELAACGVQHACIAPGSRSTPVVLALAERDDIRDWIVHDERAGAYFALGIARATRRPVVVLSTSGTAAANFLPAVAEASLAGVPLVVLTADRPAEVRGFGAPQTIDQARLYGSHVRWAFEVPAPGGGCEQIRALRAIGCRAVAEAVGPPAGPVHLNLAFREPLIEPASRTHPRRGSLEGAAAGECSQPSARAHPSVRVHRAPGVLDPALARELAAAAAEARRGLIVCGPRCIEAEAIAELAGRLDWPLLADGLSGLRFGRHDLSHVLTVHDLLLGEAGFARDFRPDFVLQFGALPVSKATAHWLAECRGARRVWVAEAGIWPDPHHGEGDLVHGPTEQVVRALTDELSRRPAASGPGEAARCEWLGVWRRAERAVRESLRAKFAELDRATNHGSAPDAGCGEACVPRVVIEALPDPCRLVVGNSMPVRDLDAFTEPVSKRIAVSCNRGASGIDGVVSAALGEAVASRDPVVLMVGDLSFLHDVAALQLATRTDANLTVVVVNNDGGGVFSFLPQAEHTEVFERYFAAPHGLRLEPIARSCGARYVAAASQQALRGAVADGTGRGGLDIIEVVSRRERNREQHRELREAARRALREALAPDQPDADRHAC